MKPDHSFPNFDLFVGNAFDRLKDIPDESVDCIVTSPPYFGLRSYENTETEWGGDGDCTHEWTARKPARIRYSGDAGKDSKQSRHNGAQYDILPSNECGKCGCWKGQLGQEPSPEMFIDHLVEIFAEVKRVLKPTGVMFVNIGDSYWGDPKGNALGDVSTSSLTSPGRRDRVSRRTGRPGHPSIKKKDLIGIPWMLAFAMRDRLGLWLRDDIAWVKGLSGEKRMGTVMPSSVEDRCTSSWEHVFVFAKSYNYFWDRDAIAEGHLWAKDPRNDGGRHLYSEESKNGPRIGVSFHEGGANMRNAWYFNVKPFKEAHYAVFPPSLIAPMVKAGCPPDGVVLDPFAGSATTATVALDLGRKAIGIEMNPENVEIIKRRMAHRLSTPVTDWM